MTKQIIKTEGGYTFNRDEVISAKEIQFGIKQPVNGTVGYFADYFWGLCAAIDADCRHPLHHWKAVPYPFFTDNDLQYAFFLPAIAVIKPENEKKYRPFKSATEFENTLKIDQLDTVVVRDKVRKNLQISTYLGFVKTQEGLLQAIVIGCDKFGPESLFKGYEWQDFHDEYARASDTWHPFGVEIKEK